MLLSNANPPKIQTRFNKIHSTPLLITKKKKKIRTQKKENPKKLKKKKIGNKEQRKKTIPSFTIPGFHQWFFFRIKKNLAQRERGKRQKGIVQS